MSVAKSREAAKARAAARKEAARKAQAEEEAARKAHAEEEAQKRRLIARVELGRAIAAGDDAKAAEAVALVDPELLAAADREGSTPLHGAASRGLERCCRKILARKDLQPEILQAQDARGWTPLHCAAAAASGSPELCSILAEHEACSVHAKDLIGRTALDVAREWGMAEAAALLLYAGHPDLTSTSLTVQTPPSESPSESPRRPASGRKSSASPSSGRKSRASPKSSRKTIALGEANAKDSPRSPKSSRKAIAKRKTVQPEATEEVGGEVAEPDPVVVAVLEAPLADDSEAPLEDDSLAADSIHEETKKDLDWGVSAGIEAATEDRLEDAVAIVIRPLWPFVNEVDKRGRNLLHLGALRGCVALCNAVLDRTDFEGTNKFDNDRATALHLAVANRHVLVCSVLVDRHVDVNLQDMRDQTPLHLAAFRGDAACYDAILARDDCDASIRDFKGRIAPDIAAEHGIDLE